jgi:hypothetical protein
MSEALEQAIVLDLAEVLEQYTRRQQELVSCLRAFRARLVAPESTPAPVQPPLPRFLEPPPPPGRLLVESPRTRAHTPVPVPVTSGTSAHMAPPASVDLPATVHSPSEARVSVRATRRDYDYFTELDEKLARLLAESQDDGPGDAGGSGDLPLS